jgi:hypothetical protein
VGYEAAGFGLFAVAYLVAVYSAMRAGHRVATAAVSVIMLAALPVAALASGRTTRVRRSRRREVYWNWPG